MDSPSRYGIGELFWRANIRIMAKTAKLYCDTWRHRLISPSGETVIAPCARTRLADLDAIGAQHMIKTCHRGEFCIPASRILAVKLNRNTIGMPAFFKQPYRRWNVGPTPEL